MRFLQTSYLSPSPCSRPKGIFRAPPTADSLPSPAAKGYLSPTAAFLLPRFYVPDQNTVSYWETDIPLPPVHDMGAQKDRTRRLGASPVGSAPAMRTRVLDRALRCVRAGPCGKAPVSGPDGALRWLQSDLSDKSRHQAGRDQTKLFSRLLP